MKKTAKLILLKGISCASKSTHSHRLKIQYNAIVLSSDKLRCELNLEETNNSVFKIINEQAYKHLNNNKSVIIDATNLTFKKHRIYRELANKCNVDLVCYYIITHPILWEKNAFNRINTLWTHYTMNEMFKIRQELFTCLNFPTKIHFDEIKFIIKDIDVSKKALLKFKEYYKYNKFLFLNNTELFFKTLYENKILEAVIPEINDMYGYEQKNLYHKLTLEKHTFKLCSSLKEKNELSIWAGVLHDTGKIIKGIPYKKSNGYYSYVGHTGASTELSMCILKRLGFNINFSSEVSNIINLHMYIPFEGNLTTNKINNIGNTTYIQLLNFRKADKLALT